MSDRNAQVGRIFSMLNILSGAPHGLTVKELHSRLTERGHITEPRNIYRDLEFLSVANFPVTSGEKVPGESKAARWRMEGLARINASFVLTYPELLALYLARGALTPLRDTPFFTDLESVFKKIEERLGGDHLNYFKQLSAEMRFEPGPRWGLGIDPDLLETVRDACAKKQVLSVMYLSVEDKKKRKRKLGPHFLYFASGSLYLVAEDLEDNQSKTYAIPRMSEAELVNEKFTGAPIAPEEYFKDVLGIYKGEDPAVSIKVEFSSKVAPFVKERRWHTSQRIVSKEGGSIIVSMQLAITPEITNWILGFGSEAFVMEPKELQAKIIQETEKMRGLYPKKAA